MYVDGMCGMLECDDESFGLGDGWACEIVASVFSPKRRRGEESVCV